MSTDPKTRQTPETLDDAALDEAAGGGHDKWIPIESISQGVHRPSAGKSVPVDQLSFNFSRLGTTP